MRSAAPARAELDGVRAVRPAATVRPAALALLVLAVALRRVAARLRAESRLPGVAAYRHGSAARLVTSRRPTARRPRRSCGAVGRDPADEERRVVPAASARRRPGVRGAAGRRPPVGARPGRGSWSRRSRRRGEVISSTPTSRWSSGGAWRRTPRRGGAVPRRQGDPAGYRQLWWYAEYEARLGAPSGARRRIGADVWRRDFEHGTALVYLGAESWRSSSAAGIGRRRRGRGHAGVAAGAERRRARAPG